MRSHSRLSAFFISLSLSIADRVKVFNARSSLNYSWKRQIRRPFSVRAYGNGDKSDLTAVFFPIESMRPIFVPLLFLLYFTFYFIILFALLHSISDIKLFSFNASCFFIFYFFCVLHVVVYLYLISPCAAFF